MLLKTHRLSGPKFSNQKGTTRCQVVSEYNSPKIDIIESDWKKSLFIKETYYCNMAAESWKFGHCSVCKLLKS